MKSLLFYDRLMSHLFKRGGCITIYTTMIDEIETIKWTLSLTWSISEIMIIGVDCAQKSLKFFRGSIQPAPALSFGKVEYS